MTFEEFAAARLAAVTRFAGVLTGDRHLAEDIVQEVLIRALARWASIGGLDRPELYVRKMVLNEFLSWRRRSWRLVPTAPASPELESSAWAAGQHAPDPGQGFADRQAMLGELCRLPRRQRAVLVLRYYEGCGDAEIGELLGCAPSTVRSNASRALAALRIHLGQPEPEPDPPPEQRPRRVRSPQAGQKPHPRRSEHA